MRDGCERKRKFCKWCGEKLTKKFQLEFCDKECNEKYRSYMKESFSKMVECKCPMCETVYKRFLFWTGNGMPRLFCDDCKQREPYVVGIDEESNNCCAAMPA